MAETDRSGWATLGARTCWLGLKVVFVLYALLVLVRVAGPAGRALGLVSGASQYRSETTGAVLVLLALVVLVALVVGLFYVAFLFVALHGVDVVVRSSAVATGELGSLVTQVGTVEPVAGSVPVGPALLFPPAVADLLYLVPPLLLVYAGVRARRLGAGIGEAVAAVVVGYATVAVLAMVPLAWLFNTVVADVLTDVVSTAATGVAFRVTFPDPLVAHLVVCVVYPLVFGGVGAVVGSVGAVGTQDRPVP
jgi:hypothetical protein